MGAKLVEGRALCRPLQVLEQEACPQEQSQRYDSVTKKGDAA